MRLFTRAGWVDNVVVLNSPDAITATHGIYNTVWKHETTLPNEYFIIENRSQLGLDGYLPSSGLAVYHCDTLGSNEWQDGTRNKHYQCALLQADGSLDLENNRNAGDATDLFSDVSGVAISDVTTPSSRMWNGTDSGLVVSEVGTASDTITFTIGEPREQPMAKAETFPNVVIPDNNPGGVTSFLNIKASGEITDISVSVEIIHSWISDLKVSLVAPDNTEVVLHNNEGADGDDLLKTYSSATVPRLAALAGNEVGGNWSIVVIDMASQDVGRLVRWSFVAGYLRRSTVITESANPNLRIPDADARGKSSEIQIRQDGEVKNIAVNVDIVHTYIGDLQIDLLSPSGQVVRLHNKKGGRSDNIKRLYDTTSTPDLNEIFGEPIRGNWKLRVRDLAAQDVGTLVSWGITLEY